MIPSKLQLMGTMQFFSETGTRHLTKCQCLLPKLKKIIKINVLSMQYIGVY